MLEPVVCEGIDIIVDTNWLDVVVLFGGFIVE